MRNTLFILSLILPFISFGQITFEKNLGDSSYQDGRCALQTVDGGFLVAGRGVDSTGRYDILLMKTDSLGNLQWRKSWGGLSSDFAATIKPTADGGYVMAATTYSFSSQPGTNSDWWIFRFDANCDTVWTRIINNIGNDQMYDAIETSDGSILACGWTNQAGYALGTIRKFSAAGALMHTSTLGSGANSYAQSVVELPSGNYMMVGSRFLSTFGADLVQFDTALNYVNDYFFNLPSTAEVAQTLERLPQGGYMLSVKTGYVLNRFDIWLLRLNDNFDTLWTRIIPQRPISIDNGDEPFGFTAVADSGYILCGKKLVGTSLRAIVYRLDTTGAIVWTQTYGGSPNGNNRFWWPLALNDGGFLLTGEYVDSITYDSNVYLVRTDAFGQQSFQTQIASAGFSNNSVYPNPVLDRLFWTFPCNASGRKSIELFSMDGRSMLRQDNLPCQGEIDTSVLPSGIYLCVVVNGTSHSVKKLIID
ncbi:MAG: T9SS type A sorting domain-containing protein [Bacteroidota bacterium]